MIEGIAQNIKFKIHYATEKEIVISNARNRVLEEAIRLNATHILFFDDDELLTQNTLEEHINIYNNNPDAYIISGPTPDKFDTNCPNYIKNHMVFKQKTTKKTGLIRKNCAAGNVFFPVAIAKEHGLRFDSQYVFMGGEDGDFFNRAYKIGYNIVWCNEAIIQEVVPSARANIKYILKKCYYNGYAGSYSKFKNCKHSFKMVLYLFKTSLVLILNSLLLLVSFLFGPTCFLNALGTITRTIGKIFGTVKNSPYNFYEVIYGE